MTCDVIKVTCYYHCYSSSTYRNLERSKPEKQAEMLIISGVVVSFQISLLTLVGSYVCLSLGEGV